MRRSSASESLLKTALPTRDATCPHCGRTFTAALKAVQLRCPGCQKPLQFQDAEITRPTQMNLATLGGVHVTRKGALTGRIDCGSLNVSGSATGTIRVRGCAAIDAAGAVAGTLHADKLSIAPGGRLRGQLLLNQPDRFDHSATGHTSSATTTPLMRQ